MEQGNASKTTIGDDVEITGTLKSTSDIQFAGTLNGDLDCSGQAVILKSASVKGNIAANSATVEGKVTGNISAKDRIELKATARITGDIKSKRLTVEDGVTFTGKAEVTPSGASTGGTPAPAAATGDIGGDKNAINRK